jgi:hypothetical protein
MALRNKWVLRNDLRDLILCCTTASKVPLAIKDLLHLIYKFTTCVRDGARVCKSGRPGPARDSRDSENGIWKNGKRKTGFGKRKKENGIRKNGIRPSSRSGPARQKRDHLCLCSAVATPELQARVCMPRVDVPDLFLFVAKMSIICRKMWKKWAILWRKI